jgi:glycosyltransferase involved in cell wall biosynthesis
LIEKNLNMNQNESPLVSVLMTAYNREQFIAEAIESVLNSTYTNFELIVVDDCSSDKTVEIARSYAEKDERIKLYVNEKKLDQFPNRNKAAGYAMGKYIKYLDSDDMIYDWGLAYCIDMMEKHPKAGMGMFQAHNKVEEEYLTPDQSINYHFFRSTFLTIGPSGIILKTKAFENAGLFDPGYGVPSDMYFNIKMASMFPIIILKKEFFFYREHEGQEIKNRYSYLYNDYTYLRDVLNLPEIPISLEKKHKLLAKAKRDFLLNSLRYIKQTGKIIPAVKAFKHSEMGWLDVVSGILNKPI